MKYPRQIILVLLTLVFFTAALRNAEAKDNWTFVRSKNFQLVGNASEKDIRKVGERLEQFRETFRLLFTGLKLTASIPTNVIVFKSDSSYRPFKPKRADGKLDTFISGYFQSGPDVNYITLSTEGEDKDMYGTIFHEYVHFIINTNFGKSEVPPWFNEGLAEYYQTFEIEQDQKIKLGLPQSQHLSLLQQNKLIPLDKLFGVSNYQLLQSGDHSRNIFYAESWALIHYLIQGGKSEGLNRFLKLLLSDKPPEKAFQEAFQTNYSVMEKELERYVTKNSYNYNLYTLKSKMSFDAEMQASPLDEADSDAYLGDLLYHNNRADDAEPFLVNALKLKPNSSMANISLGMVKNQQRKFDEAKTLLETAIAADAKNYFAYYRYAYLLSRENGDMMGFVRSFPPATADKMRSALTKAINLNPEFTESYELLAFVDLITNEHLDESISALQTALRYQPGSQRYALRLAEVYARQSKYDQASPIALRISLTSDDPEIKSRAESLITMIARKKEFEADVAANQKYNEANAQAIRSGRIDSTVVDDPLANMRSINAALRRLDADERRVIGRILKVDCKGRPIVFTIQTPTDTFGVTTNDFDSLKLNAFVPEADKAQVGCDENLSVLNAVITYTPKTLAKGTSRGELVAVEFVSKDFRFLDQLAPPVVVKSDRIFDSTAVSGTLMEPPPLRSAEAEALRRAAIMRSINEALKKPLEGQTRDMGFLDKIDCGGKVPIFVLRTASRTYRLLNSSPQSLKIGVFAPDLAGMQFGCSIKPIEIPAVFIFEEKLDSKGKNDGEILSIEFVPIGFALDQQ